MAEKGQRSPEKVAVVSGEKVMTAMRKSLRVFLIACPGIVLVPQAMCAFASGREGEAYVGAVGWIVGIVLVTFATLVVGGGLQGAFRASQSGESILKGSARGLLRGIFALLVVGAVSLAGLTILGILWIAYSFLDVYVLNPSY